MSFLDWILTLLVMVSTVILNVADYDEEDEDEESVPAVEPPRVSHHAPRVRTSNSAVITPIESQNRRRRGFLFLREWEHEPRERVEPHRR